MTKRFMLPLICSAIVAGSAFGATPADAQSSAEPLELTEVVVTAQRRSELQVDVPITITSISADQLRDGHVQSLSNIAQLTPALRFDNTSAFVQPTIRGVGTSITTAGSGANVGIYVDGFYNPDPLEVDFGLANVQGVQVLKGPQGTLFGRNTTGGAILVTTADPSTHTSVIADVSYGRFNSQRFEGYGTTGLTEKVAIDLDAVYWKGNGHVTDVVTGDSHIGEYSNYTVRTGLKITLSDALSILFRYEHQVQNDPTNTLQNSFVANGVPQTIGTIVPGTTIATDPDQVSPTTRDFFHTRNDAGQLTAKMDFGFALLTSYTQLRAMVSNQGDDLDVSSAPVFSIQIPIRDRTFTQEFILSSTGTGKLQWTGGLFYLDYTDHFSGTTLSSGGAPFAVFANSSIDIVSYAAFADATYEVTPQIFLTAGLRQSRDENRNGYFYNGIITGDRVRIDVPTESVNRTTPRGVIRYKINEDSSTYFSVSRGFKAPILNVGGNTTVPVNAESLTAYEVGYKFSQRALSLELSAFHYDYKDLQVASYNGQQSLINNAASAHINGGEAALRWRITSPLELTAGAAYTDAKFKEYTASPSYTQCLDFAACGAAGFGLFAITPIDASGFQLPRSPKFTGTLGMKYTTSVADGDLGLSANVYNTSRFNFDSSGQLPQAGYTTLGLRAEWTDPSSKLTLALYGDNVTDRRYRTQLTQGTFGPQSVWNYPATFGAGIRFKL